MPDRAKAIGPCGAAGQRPPAQPAPVRRERSASIEIDWLFESPAFSVTAWTCRESPDRRLTPKHQDHLVIGFVHRGSFVHHSRGHTAVVDPNTIVYFNPAETYETSHPMGCGDVGSALVVGSTLLAEILEENDPASLDLHGPRFPFSLHHGTAKAYLLQHLLLQHLADEGPDQLAVQETGLRLVEEVVEAPIRRLERRPRAAPSRAAASAALMNSVKSQLNEQMTPGVRLADLARSTGLSPYSLCRAFKRSSGMPIHRYLNRLRLHTAMAPITAGMDLTDLALDLGFASHSHFTAAFRREFGVPPSQLRRRLSSVSRAASQHHSSCTPRHLP